MNNRSTSTARLARAIAGVLLLAPFVAAPTPGNIGGCGGTAAATPIEPLSPTQSPEQAYFEQAICANLCYRLLECGQLCQALQNAPAGCAEGSEQGVQAAFYACTHGNVVFRPDYFEGNILDCPRACPGGSTFNSGAGGAVGVYQWDVQTCGDAITARSCGSLRGFFQSAPRECANDNVCRPQ